jgi:hypothetical protein
MNEKEARIETMKLLAFIYQEWNKEITEDLISFWRENLRGCNKQLVWKAAREMVRVKTFGEPKFQDFYQTMKEHAPRIRPQYTPWGNPESTREIIIGLPDSTPRDEVGRLMIGLNGRKLL